MVVDALSWCDSEVASEMMAISAPSFQLFNDLRAEHKADQALWTTLEADDRDET
jgi:hypothetical protein